jgi:hypothetical protein
MRGSPLAASNLLGMEVRKRSRTSSFDADDGVVRAGHAYVGLVGGAVGEDALVGGGDVGVGAEDGRDAAVEIPAEGDIFRCGFGVDVERR